MKIPDYLNQAQWSTVNHRTGHLLVVAGPGTGKTHTLTHRIISCARELKDSQKILAITFTNKASNEMRKRLSLYAPNCVGDVTIGTFHSFCLQLLRDNIDLAKLPKDFQIATPQETLSFAKKIWKDKTLSQRKSFLNDISRNKAGFPYEDFSEDTLKYNSHLRRQGLLDFDDLLCEAVSLLNKNNEIRSSLQKTYRFICVDEYQDINFVQHALLKILVGKNSILTAIGDPHQAIYGFRGCDVRFFESFSKDFLGSGIISLSDNYRSANNLIAASSQVIAKSDFKNVAAPTARLYMGGNLTIHEASSDKAEAEYVVHQIEKVVGGLSMFSHDSGRVETDKEAEYSFGDVAVLYRLNSQRHVLREAFSRSGMPYQISGDISLIERPCVFMFISLLRIASGKAVSPNATRLLTELLGAKSKLRNRDSINFEIIQKSDNLKHIADDVGKISNILKTQSIEDSLRAIRLLPICQKVFNSYDKSDDDFNRLCDIASVCTRLDEFFDHILLQRSDDTINLKAEKVSLLTLHASKGLEFPVVFIIGCESELMPLALPGRIASEQEERRLFYVGMTRAKHKLYLISSKRRRMHGKMCEHVPSIFLSDIKEELKAYERAHTVFCRKNKEKTRQLNFFEA